MAITKAQFVSDCELQVNQSAPSDDSELSKDHIAFIGSKFLNAYITEECNSKVRLGEQIPSVYITRTTVEVPELEEVDEVAESDERIFVTMDTEPLTLNNDAGVILVQTNELDEIFKANIQSMQLFKNMRFAKPSAENLVYYRAGLNIYIAGFKPVDIPFEFILVDFVPKQDMVTMDDEDEILVSDLVYPQVVAETVGELKRMLYGSQQDVANDGQDNKEIQYHTAIKSSN